MGTRIASGLSSGAEPHAAALDAAGAAAAQLADAPADLAVVFLAGAHLADAEASLERVHEALAPDVLVGCGAGGVLGAEREIEDGTAIAVWAGAFDDGAVSAFHAESIETGDSVAIGGLPDLSGADGVVLLPDPYSFPTDALLAELGTRAPTVPILGGVASARTADGDAALFLGERRVEGGGAVGVRFDGIEMLPCVSQGATPLGPELEVTASEGGVIQQLVGRPALEVLGEVLAELPDAERAKVAQGILLGVVVDSAHPETTDDDFLVRGLLGGDPDTGTVAIGTPVLAGQIVRVHARDAESADRDLRDALRLRRAALGEDGPAGALVFTCNGRGRGMFGVGDHDASAVATELGSGLPAAGFFAAGEIGPVGGRTFLHSFTATVAVFAS